MHNDSVNVETRLVYKSLLKSYKKLRNINKRNKEKNKGKAGKGFKYADTSDRLEQILSTLQNFEDGVISKLEQVNKRCEFSENSVKQQVHGLLKLLITWIKRSRKVCVR